MDRLMHLLAPKSWMGFVVRLLVLIGIVATENLLFAYYFGSLGQDDAGVVSYYLAHATIVGGPLIAFFLAVTVFQVRLQRKLLQLSRKDGLTGLNNRRTFFDLVEKARKTERRGVLLMLDADWFKRINDTYGHQAGDYCLKTIAYTLRRNVRHDDVLGRIGGEEFAIYLKNAPVETARVIGERLAKPIAFETATLNYLSVTLSVGAARSEPDLTIDVLLAQADAALYQAKQNGRAAFVLWEPAMQPGYVAQSG